MPIPIYLADTTSCAKEPDSIAAVVSRGIFDGVEAAELGITVREDVVVSEKMYLASMGEHITRKRLGCGVKTNSGALIVREKLLTVANLQVWDEICADAFAGPFWELAKKKGYAVNDLQDTEIMNSLLMELYKGVLLRDNLTIIQFGDTTISQAPPAGLESSWTAADAADYKYRLTIGTMNGFWKLVFVGVADKVADAADPDGINRVLTVPQTGTLAANYTRDVLLPGLYDGQSELMDQVDDSEKRFVLSRDLYANLEASLRNFATTGESSATILRDGAGALSYNGIPIIKNKMIAQKAVKPYAAGNPATFTRRAYLIVDGGFQVGTDTDQEGQRLTTWYSKDTDLNNIQYRYKLGMQYLDGDVVTVAY